MGASVKCVGMVAAAGAAIAGGVGAYRGVKARKNIISDMQKISDANGGKIPTGGMTKDGKLWDGFITMDDVKKDTKKKLTLGVAINTVVAGAMTALVSGVTLLAKSHIK